MRHLLSRLGVALVLAFNLAAAGPIPASANPLPGTGCNLFPADNILNVDVSGLPLHPLSATWKSHMAQSTSLHPDLGTVAQQYGLPFNVAPPPSTGLMPTFYYDAETDHPSEGYPINQSTLIEGGPGAPPGSDRHALVVNKTLCKLYELFNLQNFTDGQQPQAGSGAVWDLRSNAMRPVGWTSADAAGLPILPLLLRPDEILAGGVNHAIRFTTHCTYRYIWPGSHDAGLCASDFPPMGARFRLRPSFDISGFSAPTQVVLRAFQRYGLILADNGSDWYFQGTTDDWWGSSAGDRLVSELKTIPAAQFDAVDESGLQAGPGSYLAKVAPAAPANVSAGAGNQMATVAWTPRSGVPFTQFLVSGSPAGTAIVGGGATSATVTGLTNGTTYTFTVTASNQYGTGPPSAPSNPVTPNAGGYYRPVEPVRIFDTRDGTGGHPGRIGPGETANVRVAGAYGVDSSAAGAVLNATVTNGSAPSYLTVYPSGQARPNASNLNFLPGQQVANLVQVAMGSGGGVSVYNDQGSADVIFDLSGWYTSTPVAGGAGLFFTLGAPSRVLDTRTGLGGYSGRLGPGGTLDLKLAGTPGVPASGLSAVALNLTAVNGSAASYLAAYPAGAVRGGSNVNFPPGRNLPVRAIVRLSAAGAITIYNSEGSVDVVADVAGYYGDGGGSSSGGVVFHPTPPVRLIDTRPAYQVGPYNQPLGPGAVITATSAGQGLVPSGAAAVSANFTVTNPTCGSFLTVYPAGSPLPPASDLNFGPSDTLPNLVIARLGTGGALNAYNNLCTTDLIIDVAGWYS